MATLDKTRLKDASEKKVYSVAGVKLLNTDLTAGDTHKVFNLPADCMITAAYIVVKTAAQASSTMSIGTTPSGTDLASALVLTATGVVGAQITTEIDTTTGKSIYVTANQALSTGLFHVVVEYIEYTRNNGELTNVG